MPWLVVYGEGSWSPMKGVRFEAGVHEIDAEMVEIVRKDGNKRLMISNAKPEILVDDGVGPLTPDDIAIGRVTGRVLEVEAPPEVIEEVEEEHALLSSEGAYRCGFCPEGFPSEAALGRHVWMHHSAAAEVDS